LCILLLLICAAPLGAQISNRQALAAGIESFGQLSASEVDARIAQLAPGDRNDEIFLSFVRLRNSVASRNSAATAADVRHILAVASAMRDEATLRTVYSGLGESLSYGGEPGSSILERERHENLNQFHREQLRAAEAERLRAEQQLTALRAQGQLIAAEKMRQQLVESQRNQQLQLDYITRRSQLQNILSILLFVCLLLTIALAWSLWRVNLARKHQALEDPLTGLKNRRFVAPFMEYETERLRRSGLSALILMADIDLFKNVNDRWGHEVGDEALVQFSETLRNCMRNSDVVSRWGGEEFVIVCPQSTEGDAEVICTRIRKRLQQTPMPAPGDTNFHLSVSIGAAIFSPAALNEHWEAALARADRALYYVKQNGRDNWSLAIPEAGQTPAREAAIV
jgi:diguanylate cyclase (GGDEF)-like protein